MTFILGVYLSWIQPLNFKLYIDSDSDVIRFIGLILLFVSLILTILAYRMFKNHFTPHAPFSTPTVLIDSGVFAMSRNPVYLALVLSQFGLGFVLDMVWLLPSALILWITLHYLIVPDEEKILESLFKERYTHYKQHTRRWF
ncbi:isoprenylcysteine carboxylmethyltransferase family protein [Sulfurovum sp. XTW-4]|uniref:Isoprenylcysteine carboxylmethyltransferase family protein n=1 Tax=Sulfurovum xiamenensis TaxID=3019066 RepID=A0ABT7QR73_9BACT|nr:isoprenylcysteine carboxylmethyltransferase family protein [Sulfurovum xiamenensis]MDM5263581.1 isoprenylcysteine carboxylmethyltransferase family protein [Sulfurovum xiamenensis]